MSEHIGWMVFDDGFEHVQSDYGCAAWSETIAVRPGAYGVFRDDRSGLGYMVGYRLFGSVVRDSFQSLWCGSAVGKPYDGLKNVGKEASHFVMSYDHEIVKSPDFRPVS